MFHTNNKTTNNYQTYQRLQQQDDGDDELDNEDWSDLVQHPHSVLVINTLNVNDQNVHTTAVLPQPIFKTDGLNDAGDTYDTSRGRFPQPSSSAAPNTSFLPNDTLAKLPQTTRDFFHNKWLPSKANKATLANMPPTIVYDIQRGNIPSHDDPTLRELDIRGWTIAHRRLYYVRKQKKKKKSKKVVNNDAATTTGDTTDDEGDYTYLDPLQPSNQLYGSIFIKTDYDAYPFVNIKENEEPIPVDKNRYEQIVESVRLAINDNIQPTRISQGSSGSYFCRDRDNRIVGVFKPKNEEPYGKLNPKWTKWLHRHLFPCFFGRSCLIPNLGYISEAAASLIDRQLGTNMVPTTHLDHFTSPSFHYDYLDRRRYRKSPQHHILPLKIGSFQCFLHGYRDANVFLRDNPWPLESSSLSLMSFGGDNSALWSACIGQFDDGGDSTANNPGGPKIVTKNKTGYQQIQTTEDNNHGSTIGDYVALNMATDTNNSDDEGNDSDTLRHRTSFYGRNTQKPAFVWTPQLQHQFKLEFEKLVILDYLIRNTDRGLDNWMIRYCEGKPAEHNTSSSAINNSSNASIIQESHHQEHQPTSTASCIHGNTTPHIHIAAIDNGLAFPFKHPDEWRSYPYGWLALPSSLVAQPFSLETRQRFLPILSDSIWWHSTVEQLRLLFQVDSDFNERMFQRQMAVLRGQGYNLVRVLKDAHAGPLDTVTMERVLVNQEEIFIEYDEKRLEERSPSKQRHQNHQGPILTAPPSQSSSILDRPVVSPTISVPNLSTTPMGSDIILPAKPTVISSSMPLQNHPQDDSLIQSPLSISPSPSLIQPLQQQKSKIGTRRLRPKRSTSFNTFDTDTSSSPVPALGHRNKKVLPWKDRVRKRLSLDLGRRRLTLRQVIGSDGELMDEDYASIDSLYVPQEPVRRRILFVMETIKLVKSKLPYFTCC